ncbi:MAG: hypothetical protein ACOY40_18650 [Bacillota bacterium]
MFDWFNDAVLWAFHKSRITYSFIVIFVMAGLGAIIGLCADLFVRAFGLKLDKYTDNHVE